jgi:hypothetical protein
MTKPLPLTDFRARRQVLEPDDYGLPGEPGAGTHLISPEAWAAIWNLPDTVAIDTSNVFGSVLGEAHALSSAWTRFYEPLGLLEKTASPLALVALQSWDAFESSILCATVGYYRLAFMALRSVVENMCIALELELAADAATFRSWQSGAENDVKFGWAADRLSKRPNLKTVDAAVLASTGNDLFRQKHPPVPGGHARRFFDLLSKFAHASPGHTDGDLWDGSNGPVFVPKTFSAWIDAYFATWAFALVLLRVGRPDAKLPLQPGESAAMLGDLFENAVRRLAPGACMRDALSAVPKTLFT